MSPFEIAADELLRHESARLPDLSACTVVLPHLHAASPLLAALRRRIKAPVFLPPSLTTFAGLAALQPGLEAVEPDSVRLAQIRDFLARTGLCREQGLWPAAEELLALMAEFSACRLAPSDDAEGFLRQVRAAYGGRLNRPLERETRLVLELWHALQQGRGSDPVRDYAGRLARAARAAPGPLYTLGLLAPSPLETAFLSEWAQHHPVRALPWQAAYAARRLALAAAWAEAPGDAPLADRARTLSRSLSTSPFQTDVQFIAAEGLEHEAQVATAWIRRWVSEGRPRIALIALDRLVARRLRALLERDRILVQDETGWTFSTASVAHVLDRLFALLQDDCYHRDLLDLLKSPFVFADLDSTSRLAAVADLEREIRRQGVVAGWTHFFTLARSCGKHVQNLIDRLAQARALLTGRRRTLAEWQGALQAALDCLGARAGLEGDGAGRQLLRLLETLAGEAADHAERYPFALWKAWLSVQLERGTFRDEGIDSPIRLVTLTGARLRDFDAAILLGADAAHLPPACTTGLFNDRVRAELGLPGTAQRHTELREALADVLGHVPHVLVTWQARLDGEPNPLSPWLEVLEGLHRLAWGGSLRQEPPPETAGPSPSAGPPTSVPTPRPAQLPQRLSASAWQSLVDCPYQYFARHVLRLAEEEEVPEEMEKRDYGELVHAILLEFHTRHPRLAGADRQALIDDLVAIGQRLFAPYRAQSYLALGWQARWERHLPAYVDWARAREARGYLWRQGETAFSRDLQLPDDTRLPLHGRLDRVDEGPAGMAVLDYKTRSRQRLREGMQTPGEDVQLAFYGLLTGAAEAAYLVLDEDKPGELSLPGELAETVRLEEERLRATLTGVRDGAALTAQGVDSVCAWCEMRGLCRRDYWPVEARGQ